MFNFLKSRVLKEKITKSDNATATNPDLGAAEAQLLDQFMKETAALRGQIEISRRMSPDQETQLTSIAERLGVEPQFDDNYRKYRELWAAEHGEQVYLAPIDAPIFLRPDEQCCFYEPAVWGQVKPIGYSVFSATFPIINGVGYRIGTEKPRYKALDEIQEGATGSLCITSKRLFFDGGALSTTILFKRLSNVECYSNGIEVGKTSEQNDFFQMTPLASQYAYMAIQEINRLQ